MSAGQKWMLTFKGGKMEYNGKEVEFKEIPPELQYAMLESMRQGHSNPDNGTLEVTRRESNYHWVFKHE